ncbi:hypothetical protein AAG747_26725 [Rapidithrix thailandica]|uniref:Uncharacterized protein n=1 Tax=Rapidithrix thailandica TaxID=413964 RepID=A0AAW9SGT8_9BACT
MKVPQDTEQILQDGFVKAFQSAATSVLKSYAKHRSINSQQWHLVTGDKEEIYALARMS